jgi:putative ABC transport system permease protein
MMLRLAVAQLRFRPGRSAVLLVVLIATVACFALVGASAKTEQVTVHGTLEANSRAAYDLLARPAGSVSAAEQQGGLVSSTAMSSVDGGITVKQWHEIEQIPGVYAAAPVAVVGYDYLGFDIEVHVPDPPPGQSQVLYRLAPEFVSENGLTKVPAEDQYVYTTTSPLVTPVGVPAPDIPQRDGSMLTICQAGNDPASTSEIVPACGSTNRQDSWNTASAANPHATGSSQLPTGTQDIAWYFPFLVEAIDPVQEAKLDGLDQAITSGEYLSESAGPVSYSVAKPDAQTSKIGGCAWAFSAQALAGTRCQWTSVPVLAADASPMQEALQVTAYRMPQSAAAMVGKGATGDTLATTLPGTASAARTGSMTVTAQQIYSQLVAQLAGKDLTNSVEATAVIGAAATGANDFETLMTASPVHYASHDGAQVPQVVPPEQVVSDSEYLPPNSTVPLQDVFPDLTDTAVRELVEHDRPTQIFVPDPPANINGWLNAPQLNLVGTFNPGGVSDGSSALSAVPMQTYFPDTAAGADAASARALGGEPLRPNGNTAGLLSVSPSLLTTISSLPALENSDSFSHVDPAHGVNTAAPISVIRVKLTGHLGLDAASQARLRLVAQEIYQRTGLHVDVTEGSSPAAVTVTDPAGAYGRPQLQLAEMWSRKGAAELISSAIDQKTRLLMLLVLVLGAVFTASAVAASVRTRRPELAVLACTGWPRRSLFGLILTECALVGCAAGIGGAALAAGLAPLTGARFGAGTYLVLAVTALGLSCLAGLYPALMAARAHPGTATAQVPGGRRYRTLRVRTLARLAMVNVLRVPGRSLLAAAGVALAVAGLTLLSVLTLAFHGAASGTLLGQAIIVQVHAADYAAAATCAVLGLALAADIHYTATRDRAGEHALLQATGWTDADLTRLGAAETTITAFAGAITGCVLPVLGVWLATGAAPAGAIAAAAGIGAVGVALTMLASLAPARQLMRTPPARHLAEA